MEGSARWRKSSSETSQRKLRRWNCSMQLMTVTMPAWSRYVLQHARHKTITLLKSMTAMTSRLIMILLSVLKKKMKVHDKSWMNFFVVTKPSEVIAEALQEEDREVGAVGLECFTGYFTSGNKWPLLLCFGTLCLVTQAAYNMADWWLSEWYALVFFQAFWWTGFFMIILVEIGQMQKREKTTSWNLLWTSLRQHRYRMTWTLMAIWVFTWVSQHRHCS